MRFFGLCLQHQKGKFAGQQFELLEWQKNLIATIFGWVDEDGLRRFKRVWLEVPRKNGKSTLSSGLGLYMLFADGEKGAEVVSAASDREQARIVFDVAAGMVRADPLLAKSSKVLHNTIRNTLTGGTFKVLSADAGTKHGMNLSGLIFDEVHTQKNRDLWDTLHTSQGSREQPLSVAITTAGHDRNSIAFEQHDYAEKVRDGVIEDPKFLPVIYAAKSGMDWTSPATWKHANPSIGTAISEEYLAEECKRGIDVPAFANSFMRLHLNIWTETETRWLPIEKYDDLCGGQIDENELVNQPCWVGIDLGATQDMTAAVAVFATEGGSVTVLPKFYLPADGVIERERRYRQPFRQWADQGKLRLTPGAVTDYDYIFNDILEMRERFDLQECALDRWNATDFAIRMDRESIPVAFFGQGYVSMSAPAKRLEALVVGGKLRHGNHPVMRQHASVACIETDPAGNIKPSKKSSRHHREHIDGVVAMCMGLGRMMAHQGSEETASDIYEQGGLRCL
jgi:phage terminase large subunit-like protein